MAAKITGRTKLFAIGASSNALGTVNDLALARRLTREVGALLVVDAVHYAPHFPVDVRAMDADFLLCSGLQVLRSARGHPVLEARRARAAAHRSA